MNKTITSSSSGAAASYVAVNGNGTDAKETSADESVKRREHAVDGYQAGEAKPVNRLDLSDAVKAVPTAWDLHQLAGGRADAAAIAQGLKKGLLSPDKAAVAKAVESLRIAESFQNQHRIHAASFEGTGYDVQPWPGLHIELTVDEAKKVLKQAKESPYDGGAPARDILAMLVKEGVIRAPAGEDRSLFGAAGQLDRAYLPNSRSELHPRGDVKTFKEAWANNLEAVSNIQEAIHQTTNFNQAMGRILKGQCPFAHGNHAKGASFDQARLTVDPNAPDFVHDLLGKSGPGRIRISNSATDPNEPDQADHQTGFRLVIPVGGTLDDPNTARIDITANTGAETHAESGKEHTRFSKVFSAPVKGLLGSRPARILRHFLAGEPLERAHEIKVALGATKQAAKETFNEHLFYGRHSFFFGGRHVQVYFKVEEPTNFEDIRKSKDPNADGNAIKKGIKEGGLKVSMYMAEMPEGRPELVNEENWKGAKWFKAATVTLPAQEATTDSAAHQWFMKTPHVPVGSNKLFWGEGIAADRAEVYRASGWLRYAWAFMKGMGNQPFQPGMNPPGW